MGWTIVAYRIHILGASGSGTTTLGKALSDKLRYKHFDTDNYIGGMNIRSKALHEKWMEKLMCPIIRLEGDLTVEERVKACIQKI